ncbi:MAG TPA: response regulator [Caulobacteraceae bacterium]|jgi:CheY-like chemotaxis protein
MNTAGITNAAEVVQTVLVVDDEVLVRMVIAAYLRDCGYRVVEAANADEARLVIEQDHDGRIEIVLSDVEMPNERDGFALAQWIRARRPELQVILAGTPRRAAEAAGDLCENGPTLTKPYEPQAVIDRIRRFLARRPSPQA